MRAIRLLAALAAILGPLPLAHAAPLLFDVTQPEASGPPYPTAAVTFDVLQPPDPITPPDPIHTLGVSLFDASYPPDPMTPLPMRLLGRDDGAGRAPGRTGMIDAVLGNPPDGSFPAHSLFDMIVAVMGVDPSPFQPGSPRLGAVGAGAFDVLFDLRDERSVVSHMLHFAIGAGQPLAFAGIQVDPPQSPSFHLTFALDRTGGVPQNPLFAATLSGTLAVPEPPALALLAAGGALLPAAALPRRRA